MSQEEWEEEKCHCSFVTDDRKRRRVTALEARKAASATEACLCLGGGQPEWSQHPAGRNFSSSPSSPGYYAEGPSISQMPFSPDSAPRGSSAFRFPVDLNSSPEPRRSDGHVTDGTGLPRYLFHDEGRSTHQVFGSASGVSMGEDKVSFLTFYVLCVS
jgi:hypothetical protein